jgi:hypothetical protein
LSLLGSGGQDGNIAGGVLMGQMGQINGIDIEKLGQNGIDIGKMSQNGIEIEWVKIELTKVD